MKFEEELQKGNFVIPFCSKCDKTTWPPSEFCSYCLGEVSWKNASTIGKIIEFSKKDDVMFCLAEFEGGIRIMGSLVSDSVPEIRHDVKIVKTSLKNGNYSFEMSLL